MDRPIGSVVALVVGGVAAVLGALGTGIVIGAAAEQHRQRSALRAASATRGWARVEPGAPEDAVLVSAAAEAAQAEPT